MNNTIERLVRDIWFQTAHGDHTMAECQHPHHSTRNGARVETHCADCTASDLGKLTGKPAAAKAMLRHIRAIRKLEIELGVG